MNSVLFLVRTGHFIPRSCSALLILWSCPIEANLGVKPQSSTLQWVNFRVRVFHIKLDGGAAGEHCQGQHWGDGGEEEQHYDAHHVWLSLTGSVWLMLLYCLDLSFRDHMGNTYGRQELSNHKQAGNHCYRAYFASTQSWNKAIHSSCSSSLILYTWTSGWVDELMSERVEENDITPPTTLPSNFIQDLIRQCLLFQS